MNCFSPHLCLWYINSLLYLSSKPSHHLYVSLLVNCVFSISIIHLSWFRIRKQVKFLLPYHVAIIKRSWTTCVRWSAKYKGFTKFNGNTVIKRERERKRYPHYNHIKDMFDNWEAIRVELNNSFEWVCM